MKVSSPLGCAVFLTLLVLASAHRAAATPVQESHGRPAGLDISDLGVSSSGLAFGLADNCLVPSACFVITPDGTQFTGADNASHRNDHALNHVPIGAGQDLAPAVVVTPEPASLLLLGSGVVAMAARARRQRRQ
jgi:hypothetical protein